jgi:hypothetical protein
MTEPKPNSLMAAHQFAVAREAVEAVLGIPKDDIAELARPTYDDFKLYVQLKDGTRREFDLTHEQLDALATEGRSRMNRISKERP